MVIDCTLPVIGASELLGDSPREKQEGSVVRKQDLVRVVSRQTNQTESQTTSTVNAVFGAIQEALSRGEEVTISGFGTFRVVERAAREGRNPRTGGAMTIAARRSPTFRPGSQLKRAVGAAEGSAELA